jgi:2-keto-myo-inositol isomerase
LPLAPAVAALGEEWTMTSRQPRFALNHMAAPRLAPKDFFALASSLRISEVEIRNDLAGNAILDGTSPATIASLAREKNVSIISINALQRFNEWTPRREAEAVELASYAQACGARALVLVPVNDGSGRAKGERQGNLRVALKALKPILAERGLVGLVEPLGFEICSLRSKTEAADAIAAIGGSGVFKLVHDTFHHHLAGEKAIFPALTGLVHISGVVDPGLSISEMRDPHRVLVDAQDRVGNVAQIRALLAAGYDGPLSFEPFSPAVQQLADPRGALAGSIAFIKACLLREAA